MNSALWDVITHFTPKEFPEPHRMDYRLISELNKFREYINVPITVTSSTNGTHEEGSYHYSGRAVDIIVPKYNLLNLYLAAERFQFNGIGVYPDWHLNQVYYGGLHLDVRDLHGRWGAVNGENGQEYCSLNEKFIKDELC